MKVKYRGTSMQGRGTYIFPYRPLADPDLQIRGKGGGVGGGLNFFFFRPSGLSWSKNKGGGPSPGFATAD